MASPQLSTALMISLWTLVKPVFVECSALLVDWYSLSKQYLSRCIDNYLAKTLSTSLNA